MATERQLSFVDGERGRIVWLLERALERYDEKQIREYLKGIVDFNEAKQ